MSHNLPFAPCGCPRPSSPCEDFPEPTVPDLGICHPKQVQTDCEAPVIPPSECNDTFVTTYDPDLTPPFQILAHLFDQDCEMILDENDEPILTNI